MSVIIDWEIERSIAALLGEFSWRVDHAAGPVAELFTEDAIISSPAGVISGREQIAEKYARNRQVRSLHYSGNLRIIDLGAGRYLVQSYALTLNVAASQENIRVGGGVLTDEIVFRDGKALFARRKLELSFLGTMAGSC